MEIFAGALRDRQKLNSGPESAVCLSAPHDHAAPLLVDRAPEPDKTGRQRDIRCDPQTAIADVDTLHGQFDPFQPAKLDHRYRQAFSIIIGTPRIPSCVLHDVPAPDGSSREPRPCKGPGRPHPEALPGPAGSRLRPAACIIVYFPARGWLFLGMTIKLWRVI